LAIAESHALGQFSVSGALLWSNLGNLIKLCGSPVFVNFLGNFNENWMTFN